MSSELVHRRVQEGSGDETSAVIADRTTWHACDECGSDAEGIFYEIGLPTGGQVVVWYGYPRGWFLTIPSQADSVVNVCSFECVWPQRRPEVRLRPEEFECEECRLVEPGAMGEVALPAELAPIVWQSFPEGWLVMLLGHYIVSVCSRSCAWAYSRANFKELQGS